MITAFTSHFRVALHDTDAAGVLFFAHLFRHAHDAYEALMTEIGYPLPALIDNGELALPLVHAEADYQHPMRHGARVDIELRVSRIGRTSFRIGYRFLDAAGELAATVCTVHACIRVADGGVERLPARLSTGLMRFAQPRH